MSKFFDYSRIAFWIGLILVIYFFIALLNESSKNYKLSQQADQLESQIAQLQSEVEDLGYKISYYKTDLYKEKVAREKLGLQQPGESVVIVPGSKEDTKSVMQASKPANQPPKTNFQQWADFLFGS